MKMKKSSSLGKVFAALAALCLVAIVNAPPSFAAPTLNVSQLTGLQDGQTITVSGGGFAANMGNIAVGQCVSGYKGPADCNTASGATFRNADASGSIGSFTLVVREKFGSIDCTQVQCVIAAAPLPTTEDAATVAANQVVHQMSFGAPAAEAAAETTTTETTTTETETSTASGATAGEELPRTGPGDELPAILLGGTIMVLLAGAVLTMTRRGGSADTR